MLRATRRLFLPWLAVFLAGALLSCSGGERSSLDNLEYIEGQHLDIHATASMASAPVVVVLHGAGLDRSDYTVFAQHLARAGALVFNADWGILSVSASTRLEHVACAVRYARLHAPEHGGDPDRLVLVGHSAGAIYAGRVATAGEGLAGSCSPGVSATPNALVLVAPAQLPGGPGPWPHSALAGDSDVKVAVVHGLEDEVVDTRLGERTVMILEDSGYDVTLHLITGGHYDPLMAGVTATEEGDLPAPSTAAQETIRIILDLAG